MCIYYINEVYSSRILIKILRLSKLLGKLSQDYDDDDDEKKKKEHLNGKSHCCC